MDFAGVYDIEVRVASSITGGRFHIEFDGVDKTGMVSVPNTGSDQGWQTVTLNGVSLNAGQQVMRLAIDAGGFSLNKFNFLLSSSLPPDTIPPTTPTSLQANPISSSQINLTWTAATDNVGVIGYNVYRDGSLNPIDTSPTPSYSDSGLIASRTYSYEVSAFDATGNEGSKSTPASATTKAPPSAVGVEQRCADLGVNCICAESANGGGVELVVSNWGYDLTQSTTKQCTIGGTTPGLTIWIVFKNR